MACDNRFLSRTEWITHYSETTRRPDWPRNAYRYSLILLPKTANCGWPGTGPWESAMLILR